MTLHKIRIIPLLNELEQELRLPKKTEVLTFQESSFLPEMHVMMPNDQKEYDNYKVMLSTAFHKETNMDGYIFVTTYKRNLDGLTVYCFYQRGSEL